MPQIIARRTRAMSLAFAVLGTAGVLSAVPGSEQAAALGASQTYLAPTSGSWTIVGHGNGHGHGLSQYGAYGRALAGQTAQQILSFYYAGATPSSGATLQSGHPNVADTPVRVELQGAGRYTAVVAALHLRVTGVNGDLPTRGTGQFRLVPSGPGLALQALGVDWRAVPGAQNLPATATISSSSGSLITVVQADNSQVSYRGTISAVRSGASDITVNTLHLDDYVRGVAPNESPSSWPAAALQAQVVAARTYALFEVQANGGTGSYDVCDSSSCQVYGGQSSEADSTNAAVTATAGDVMLYRGTPIFAQFSSSNGGWTADGAKPYLIAQPDPYDNARTDPWFNWTRSVPVSQLASYYGLSTVTALRVLARSGHGDWGGAVISVAVQGTVNGVTTSVTDTGYGIRSALNLPLQWFTITNGGPVLPGAPTALSLQPDNGTVAISWQPPGANGAKPVQRYRVTVAGLTRVEVAANTRAVTIGGLTNGIAYRVSVQALTADGIGAATVLPAIAGRAPLGTPAAPAPAAASPANRSAVIFWAPSSDPALSGYSVTVLGLRRYVVSSKRTFFTLPALPNGVTESVYVRALNADGEGPAVVLGVRAEPVPASPRAVVVTATGTTARVNWKAPAANGTAAVTGYSLTLVDQARRFLLTPAARSTTLTGLRPGTRYRLYVRALNPTGAGPAYLMAFTTK